MSFSNSWTLTSGHPRSDIPEFTPNFPEPPPAIPPPDPPPPDPPQCNPPPDIPPLNLPLLDIAGRFAMMNSSYDIVILNNETLSFKRNVELLDTELRNAISHVNTLTTTMGTQVSPVTSPQIITITTTMLNLPHGNYIQPNLQTFDITIFNNTMETILTGLKSKYLFAMNMTGPPPQLNGGQTVHTTKISYALPIA